ncbi:MAG: zf-HC2 domain-containing protein [Actinobacteria bacterium]|nr:zf-HC2 domain-containing protein [Actinomycetota bacterium]
MSLRDRLRRRRLSDRPACVDVVEIVTDYLEGALSPADRARFDTHLDGCQGCRAYLEQMRRTIDISGRLSEEEIPDEIRESLLVAFRSRRASG